MELNKHPCSQGTVILVEKEVNKSMEYRVIRDAMKKIKGGLEDKVGAGFCFALGRGRVLLF